MADPAPVPQGINFKKIVENVISYLVTSVFIGACVIVWRGATTVDERVGRTETNVKVLIDNLSAKLSAYEAQMKSQSNQLEAVYSELKAIKPLVGVPPSKPVILPMAEPLVSPEEWQRMRQQSIQQELLKK